jgi:hypothetical protein
MPWIRQTDLQSRESGRRNMAGKEPSEVRSTNVNKDTRQTRSLVGLPGDWRRQLERLKQSLVVTARQASWDRYRHAILWFDGDLPDRISAVHPRVYASGGPIHHTITVPLPHGGHHVHFFFDDMEVGGKDDLKSLMNALGNTQRILHTIPKRVLPTFAVPPVGDGLTEDLLTWLYLLHWLGHDPNNTVFRSQLEFTSNKSGLSSRTEFREWNRCSTLPDFDAVRFLTLSHSAEKAIDSWQEEHRSAEKPLPEVIACSLSKPLGYASMNAIDLILRQDQFQRELRETNSEKATTHIRKPTTLQREKDLAELYKVVFGHFLKHHGDPMVEPLTWKEIRARLPQGRATWSQSKISRVMARLLKAKGDNGMTAYRDAFKSRNPFIGLQQYDPEGRRTVDGIIDPNPVFDEDDADAEEA